MKSQNFFHTKGLVVKRTNYGETDKIITLLTSMGKVDLMVKGARKETSKMLLASQPFVLLEVSYLDSGRDLKILTSVSPVTQFSFVDLEQINIAYGVLGFARLLLENSEQTGLFDLTEQAFVALTDKTSNLSPLMVSVWYLLHVLQNLGQMPDIHQDTDGHTMTKENKYSYDVTKHGFCRLDSKNRHDDTAVLKIIRYYLANESVSNIRPVSISAELQKSSVSFVQRLASEALEQDISRLFLSAV